MKTFGRISTLIGATLLLGVGCAGVTPLPTSEAPPAPAVAPAPADDLGSEKEFDSEISALDASADSVSETDFSHADLEDSAVGM